MPILNILKNVSPQFKQTIRITCIAKYINAYMIYNDFHIYPFFYHVQNNYPPLGNGKPNIFILFIYLFYLFYFIFTWL